MKKQILTIISLILTIGMILPTANAEEISTYSDYVVEGQSTYADSFGLMKGYDDGTFKPDNNMTRAEFTSALMRAAVIANPDAQLAEINFSDIDKSYWAYDDIAYAKNIGWLNGYADGTFKGDNNITRAEVVTVTNHATGRTADKDYINKNESTLNKFTNLKNNAHWAYCEIMEAANTHKAASSDKAETWVK